MDRFGAINFGENEKKGEGRNAWTGSIKRKGEMFKLNLRRSWSCFRFDGVKSD